MTLSALAMALGAFGVVYVASLLHRREQDEADEGRRDHPRAVH